MDKCYIKGSPIPDLASAVDLYHDARDLRLAMEKEAAAVQERERELKDHIIANLSKSENMTGIAGKRYRAQRVEKEMPKAEDWKAIWAFIVDNERFDLVQKRLSDKAVKDLWEEGEEVPGVGKFINVDISVTKI